jgi:hypothetical protein
MAWVVVASVMSASCTRVLGIDGNYVVASAGGAGTGGASGAAGKTGSGGTLAAAGGVGGDVPGSGGDGRGDSGSTSGNGGTGEESDAAPPIGGASASGGATSGGAPNSGGVTNSGGARSSFDAGRDGATSTVLCRIGSYEGRFKGTVQFPAILDVPDVPIPVQGDVTLEVAPGQSATLFAVTGKLGPDSQIPLDAFVPFSSDVAGTLDCATGVLAANLDNGQVRSLVVYAFEGTLTATYDKSAHEFTGSWIESESGPPPAGSGTGDINAVVWQTP